MISSTLVSLHSSLSRPLTTLDKSLITSSTSLFALLASPLAGLLADAYGRKRAILAASLLFVGGALLQAAAGSVAAMVLGRSVVGLAVGGASFVVPLYIAELAPSSWRGRLVTVASLFVTGGQVVAYVVGWWLAEREEGWRWMVGLGALPAAGQVCVLVAMPETPRWLVRAGRKEQARRVLARVYGEGMGQVVEGVLRRVEREILDEENVVVVGGKEGGRWRERVNGKLKELVAVSRNRRALVIACMLQGFQQLCGFVSRPYSLRSNTQTASSHPLRLQLRPSIAIHDFSL